MEAADRKSGGGRDAYWLRATKQLWRNSIDLLVIATGELDLAYLYRLVASAPTSIAEAADKNWQGQSDCYVLLEAAKNACSEKHREADFKIAQAYWLREYAGLPSPPAGCYRQTVVPQTPTFRDASCPCLRPEVAASRSLGF